MTMTDHDDVNATRRLLMMLGAAAPLVSTALAVPRAASAAEATHGAPEKAGSGAMPASTETLPPAGLLMHPAYAQVIARMAYVWGWPMVNMLNRNARITKAPHPGLLAGILPAAPRGQVGMLHDYIDPAETFVTCPNQDVVYGLGFFSLDEEPVVAQVPRLW